MAITNSKGAVAVTAYQGDAKTLLAFDLKTEAARHQLAGFTIQITPPQGAPYYLLNELRFENPASHAQDPKEPANSTLNAPIHKFRWVHVPGLAHQGVKADYSGKYTYTVTPRYFSDAGSLLPIDTSLGVPVLVPVAPFAKGKLALGFTRGYTQSQAFVRHFGLKASIRPKDAALQFDTSQQSGTNAQGQTFTYAQQYEWLGFTARQRIFDLLDAVQADGGLRLDVFAYDLNEPDIVGRLLALGKAGRARIILDDAALHHDSSGTKPEDQFAALFAEAAGAAAIKRGHFGRYAHDKVFIVRKGAAALKVLTGSTNFSVTGLYVNSNHVLVFDDPNVAGTYAQVFEEAWNDNLSKAKFAATALATERHGFGGTADLPKTGIAFSPHSAEMAGQVLNDLVSRINAEGQDPEGKRSVLFAVMELGGTGNNPVYDALKTLHQNQEIFSYGISDDPSGICLYPVGSTTGVLVTGKPVNTQLPPPFSQVPNVGGIGHQIHHKFIVCGFNGTNPVVYCGSSNLALMGEQVNGDNLLAIHDADVAAVFAIEALTLVDHFNFLDSTAKGPKAKSGAQPAAVKDEAAAAAGWFLGTDDSWCHKYFDPSDLHYKDRVLFAG